MDHAPWWTADYALSPYWPVVVAVVPVAAYAAWVRLGRSSRGLAVAGVVLAWGVVVAATLTPIPRVARSCALSVSASSWAHVADWSHERSLNVALFVPLGVAVWLTRRRWPALAAAVLAPFVIEAVQALAPAAGRDCDANDVVANLLGVAVGLVVGALGAAVLRPRLRQAAPDPEPNG